MPLKIRCEDDIRTYNAIKDAMQIRNVNRDCCCEPQAQCMALELFFYQNRNTDAILAALQTCKTRLTADITLFLHKTNNSYRNNIKLEITSRKVYTRRRLEGIQIKPGSITIPIRVLLDTVHESPTLGSVI